MSKLRIFRVAVKGAINGTGQPEERLVRAGSQAQATAHVSKDLIKCEVADQEDVFRLAKAGVVIEDTSKAGE